VNDDQLELDAQMRAMGRTALQIFRGAREDGSLVEAFWATAAFFVAAFKQNEE